MGSAAESSFPFKVRSILGVENYGANQFPERISGHVNLDKLFADPGPPSLLVVDKETAASIKRPFYK